MAHSEERCQCRNLQRVQHQRRTHRKRRLSRSDAVGLAHSDVHCHASTPQVQPASRFSERRAAAIRAFWRMLIYLPVNQTRFVSAVNARRPADTIAAMISPHPKPPMADRRNIIGTPADPRRNTSSPSTATATPTVVTATTMDTGCHNGRKRRANNAYAATTASIRASQMNALNAL
jgi:hypothetical protein